MPITSHRSGPDLPLHPAYRFNTTTTAEPSGRNSATVSKSVLSLATSPTLRDPSGMNLLNMKAEIIRTPGFPGQHSQTLNSEPRLCHWALVLSCGRTLASIRHLGIICGSDANLSLPAYMVQQRRSVPLPGLPPYKPSCSLMGQDDVSLIQTDDRPPME